MKLKLLLLPVLLICVAACERRLIYFPPAYLPSVDSLHAAGLQYWPAKEEYRGFTLLEPPESALGTVVFFHGNGSLASDRFGLARVLRDRGFQVVLLEFPGYGERKGAPSEKNNVTDAVDAVRRIVADFKQPLYFWGESIGAGVAASVIAALSEDENPVTVVGLVLQVPFDSLPSVARHHYGFFPKRLIRDRYNNIGNLGDYDGKVAVLLAGEDKVVPSQFGKRLFDAINTTKKLWMFEKEEHYIPIERYSSSLDEVISFISG